MIFIGPGYRSRGTQTPIDAIIQTDDFHNNDDSSFTEAGSSLSSGFRAIVHSNETSNVNKKPKIEDDAKSSKHSHHHSHKSRSHGNTHSTAQGTSPSSFLTSGFNNVVSNRDNSQDSTLHNQMNIDNHASDGPSQVDGAVGKSRRKSRHDFSQSQEEANETNASSSQRQFRHEIEPQDEVFDGPQPNQRNRTANEAPNANNIVADGLNDIDIIDAMNEDEPTVPVVVKKNVEIMTEISYLCNIRQWKLSTLCESSCQTF